MQTVTEPATESLRRIEEASLNAWPALYQMLHDGWLLRFSRGFTKRSNSVVPLYRSASEPAQALEDNFVEKVRFCENLYAREGMPTTFRIPDIVPDRALLEALLTNRGYRRIEETLVLACPLDRLTDLAPQHPFDLAPLEDWLREYAGLIDAPAPASDMHRVILRSIFGECGFGLVRDSTQTLACGLGVVEASLCGLFDIVTHAGYRRQGLGSELIGHLARWAEARGAETAYLQVVATNDPALALYDRLDFEIAYRYAYFQAN